MLIRLSSTGMYSKLTPDSDYSLMPDSAPDISRATIENLSRWLQIVMTSNAQVATGLHQIDGHWWLFRAQKESSTDSANRPRGFVVFGRVEEELDRFNAVSLVYEFCRLRLDRQKPPPCEVFLEPLPVGNLSASTAAALLSLVSGSGPASVCQSSDAIALLQILPLSRLAWLAFFPYARPVARPPGNGLLINDESDVVSSSLQALLDQSNVLSMLRLPLPEMLDLPDSWDTKLKLIEAALGVETVLALSDMSEEGFWWLGGSSSVGRQFALSLVEDTLTTKWLASDFASAADLFVLKPFLTDRDQSACIRLLSMESSPFQTYAALFPNDLTHLWDLLSPAAKSIGERLQSLTRSPSAEELDWYFQHIAGTAIDRLPLDVLAVAASTGSQESRNRFSSSLNDAGLDEFVAAQLTRNIPLNRVPNTPPGLPPSRDWLTGIAPLQWMEIGDVLKTAPSWYSWWISGLEEYGRMGSLSPEDLRNLGIVHRNPEILKLSGAPNAICRLVQNGAPDTTIAEIASHWDDRYRRLIELMCDDGSFHDRIKDSLSENAIQWLSTQGFPDQATRLQSLCQMLGSHRCVPVQTLIPLAYRLNREQRLSQIAAWYQMPSGGTRDEVLHNLIFPRTACFRQDEVDYFDATIFSCRPLPRLPDWNASELACLLPLIGVNTVIRHVMARVILDPNEDSLLEDILRLLSSRPHFEPVPAPDTTAQSRRRVWYERISQLLANWNHSPAASKNPNSQPLQSATTH